VSTSDEEEEAVAPRDGPPADVVVSLREEGNARLDEHLGARRRGLVHQALHALDVDT